METKDASREQVRVRILEVANNLFNHYGFGKTTMADIAKECDMSPANIYRFYEGKEDIMAEIAENIAQRINASLKVVVRKPGLTAGERIEALIIEKIKLLDSLCACHSRMDEAIEFIQEKRPDIISKHLDIKRSMLAEIISEGNRTKEFDVDNVVAVADDILHATFLCKCQWADKCVPVEEIITSARRIIGLILKGINIR